MKYIFLFFVFLCLRPEKTFSQNAKIQSLLKSFPSPTPVKERTQIMFLGSSHFGQEQMYKNAPAADLFSAVRQKEIAYINAQLAAFKPDVIMVEEEPEQQYQLDSLYTLFKTAKLKLTDLSYGRAEQYQFGFNLARALKHQQVFAADYYESVSNRMLRSTDNMETFQKGLDFFSVFGRKADSLFKAGLSLKDYLLVINTPQILDWTYQVLFVTPLQLKNGEFASPPPAYVDTAYINKKYIGAEFVSVFLERELKIYSNIVTTQLRQKAKRILVIMGHRHAAVLPKLFQNDPAYKIIRLSEYLK